VWHLNVGDYISLVAFVIAIWQIRRAGNLARAANDAVRSASARSNVYQLLLLAPQFERCEAQLESAALQGDANQVLDRVREWRKLAAELRGLLRDEHDGRQLIEQKLDQSLTLANLAKKRTISPDGNTLIQGTEKLRQATSDTTDLVVTLAAHVRTNLGSVGNGDGKAKTASNLLPGFFGKLKGK
jgi:hypothetical protein